MAELLRTEGESQKTAIQIGDEDYEIDLSKIPYLSSFVRFQTASEHPDKFVHGPIPQFEAALKGLESGYRQCFRSMPTDLAQHQSLCETYEFLGVDVLQGQSISEITRE